MADNFHPLREAARTGFIYGAAVAYASDKIHRSAVGSFDFKHWRERLNGACEAAEVSVKNLSAEAQNVFNEGFRIPAGYADHLGFAEKIFQFARFVASNLTAEEENPSEVEAVEYEGLCSHMQILDYPV